MNILQKVPYTKPVEKYFWKNDLQNKDDEGSYDIHYKKYLQIVLNKIRRIWALVHKRATKNEKIGKLTTN